MATAVRERTRPENIEDLAQQGPPARDASDEDKALYVAARYAVQDDHYQGLYQLWTKVLFFLVGKQWLRWNETQAIFEPDTDVPPWRQQPVTNFTYAIFRTAVAKLSKNRPILEVVPPSGDSEDREAAKLGEAIVEFLWRHLKSPQKLVRAIGWFVCTGNVFLDVDWDPDAGKLRPRTVLVETANPDNPLETIDVECPCDENGEPYRREPQDDTEVALDGGQPYDLDREPDVEPEGEISLDVDDPFSVRFNPDASSPEEAEEWFCAKLWPRSAVEREFDVELDDPAVTAGEASGEQREEFEDTLSRVASSAPDPFRNPLGTVTGSDQADAIGDRVLVIYYYRKPSVKEGCPHGRHWIVAGTKKVWPPEDDPEYPTGEAPLPFGFWPPRIPILDTPIPGQPQGLGMLTQIVPLNEQLNHLDGKILEFHLVMTMGGVWFVAPDDKGITITSEPGQVKVSKAMGAMGRNGAPFQAQMHPLPASVYQERAVLLEKMRTVANMSEVDMSQRPEGVTAGRAFLVLQEASDAAITTGLQAIETAIQELGRRELVIAQAQYTEERTISVRGDKGQWEFRSFAGADLRDGHDVRVQPGSSFPWSKSAQWDTKLSVIQALPQLVLKPDGSIDRESLGKYLDAGAAGLSAFETDEDPDAVEVQREHAMFEALDPDNPNTTNEVPQIGFWQEHAIHQRLHYDFLKRNQARFRRWHPAAQEAFLQHCRDTLAAIQQQVDELVPAPPPAPAEGGMAPDAAPPPGGGRSIALVPGGGPTGRAATPTASPVPNPLRLQPTDFAAAGQ